MRKLVIASLAGIMAISSTQAHAFFDFSFDKKAPNYVEECDKFRGLEWAMCFLSVPAEGSLSESESSEGASSDNDGDGVGGESDDV